MGFLGLVEVEVTGEVRLKSVLVVRFGRSGRIRCPGQWAGLIRAIVPGAVYADDKEIIERLGDEEGRSA